MLEHLVLVLALAAPDGPAKSPLLERDLGGSPERCRQMARHLLSSDVAEWREAQFRLAMAGPAALKAIDSQRLFGDANGRERVRGVVQLALGRAITPKELEAHPRLHRLVADSVARGFALAPMLAAMRSFPGPDAYDYMVEPLVDRPHPPRPDEQIFALGRCAVPAALSLLRDPRPVGRAWGISILATLRAAAVADSVAPLTNDSADFAVWHGDYGTREVIGARAKAFVASQSEGPEYDLVLAVGNHADLLGGILETSRARQATTWDEWWNEARPVWRDWWRLAGDGPYPPDREAWWNALFEYKGFRLSRIPNAEPRTVLNVKAPPGTRCRVETDSAVVAEGEPPLVVMREQDSASVALRDQREMKGDYSDRTFDVIATLPDGRSFRNGFFWQPQTRITVELLPALKPRDRRGPGASRTP